MTQSQLTTSLFLVFLNTLTGSEKNQYSSDINELQLDFAPNIGNTMHEQYKRIVLKSVDDDEIEIVKILDGIKKNVSKTTSDC